MSCFIPSKVNGHKPPLKFGLSCYSLASSSSISLSFTYTLGQSHPPSDTHDHPHPHTHSHTQSHTQKRFICRSHGYLSCTFPQCLLSGWNCLFSRPSFPSCHHNLLFCGSRCKAAISAAVKVSVTHSSTFKLRLG